MIDRLFRYFVLLIYRDCKRDFYLQGDILWSIFSYSRLEKALKRKRRKRYYACTCTYIYIYIFYCRIMIY